jgi:anti-sigma-K factor RskA
MTCLSKNAQGAELLASYLAKTLDAARRAELDGHFEECAECRGLVSAWERLDEFAAPEVSPGFDARLYARIAADDARRSMWWRRLLWRPIVPLVAAGALVALALFVHVPGNTDAAKRVSPTQSNKAEIEQVAQALDDMNLLIPIDR